ncbi:MAG: hypothetical protein ACJAZO_005405 [Myxococcota bacterium]|jgi:hypothetical protein
MAALFSAPGRALACALRPLAVAAVVLSIAGSPAFAQDEGDEFNWDESAFDDLDDAGGNDAEDDTDAADNPPADLGADELDFGDEDEMGDFEFLDTDDDSGVDLLGGEVEPQFDDNAVVYRRTQERAADMAAEEEVELWEAYLRRYESSAFEGRIRDRIDEVISELYGETLQTGEVDALDEEIDFSQGLNLEIMNPRTTIQGGIELGFPDYVNPYFGYDHQLARNFSVGGSLRRRYTGASVEATARYAIIKSVKTNTLLTAIGTVHFNADPTFIGFRPMIAAGKRFADKIDVQGQLGSELELGQGPVGMRWFFGANVTYRASDTVAAFVETSGQLKNITFSPRPFNFTVFTFGMKFMPQPKGLDPGQLQFNVGANVPYATSYYRFHFGSIMLQVNYYPKSRR